MKMKVLLFLLAIVLIDMTTPADSNPTLNNPYVWMLVKQSDRMQTKISDLDKKIEEVEKNVNELKSKETQEGDFKIIADIKKRQEMIVGDLNNVLETGNKTKKSLSNMALDIGNLKTKGEKNKEKIQNCQTKCRDVSQETGLIKARLSSIESNILKIQKDLLQCLKKDDIIRCPYGWKQSGNHCYFFSNSKRTWHQAKVECEKVGAYLLKIDNKAEHDWLKSVIRSSKRTRPWIGLNDIANEGQWRWVSDNSLMTYSSWNKNEPNSFNGVNEDCVDFWEDENWNDSPCYDLLTYICEKE